MSLKILLRTSPLPLLLLGAGMLAAGSCSYDDIPTPTEGTLRVETVTTGSGLDDNGYTVIVNNSAADQIGAVDVVYLDALDTGTYEVGLGGLQENCQTLTGTNPQRITVLPADTVGVDFSVTCTTLPPPPPDGPPEP